jgi:hypothetical protein
VPTRSYGTIRIVPLIATPITTLAATKQPPHSPGLSVRAAPSAAAVSATHAWTRPSSNSFFERHVVYWSQASSRGRVFSHFSITTAQIFALMYILRLRSMSFDAGPFVAALEYASGREATVLGKPSRTFFTLAVEGFQCAAGRWR